ncbi:MAG TPA: hypothetical protein PLQ85_12960, partial [Anaerolineae bacterium]|nr:hypothetical protein [Anaerolineae bacterium]
MGREKSVVAAFDHDSPLTPHMISENLRESGSNAYSSNNGSRIREGNVNYMSLSGRPIAHKSRPRHTGRDGFDSSPGIPSLQSVFRDRFLRQRDKLAYRQ